MKYPDKVYKYIQKHPDLKPVDIWNNIKKKFNIDIGYRYTFNLVNKYCRNYKPPKSSKKYKCFKNYKPGEEFKSGKYTFVKTEDGFMYKHRYIYEQYYGPIKPDDFIIFLDDNKENYNIDNLYCVNRRQMMLINAMLKGKVVTKELKMLAINTALLTIIANDRFLSLTRRIKSLTTKQKRIIDLYRSGKTGYDIVKETQIEDAYTKQIIRKYNLGFFDNFYKDREKK